MIWTLEFTATARKEIRKLDSTVCLQLEKDFQEIARNPQQGKLLQGRLKGTRSWRSGDYRILCGIWPADRKIIVYRVAHRREVYL